MAQSSSVETLLAQVAEKHDEKAMAELIDRQGPLVLGVLVRMLGDRTAAEEIFQDVFMEFWHDARRLHRAGVSAAAALVLIARARALVRLRSTRKAPTRSPLGEKAVDWLPQQKEIALLEERRELLRKVIAQLPKSQHEALEMAVFGGRTDSEIAAELREPGARARTSLLASMSFLRHRFAAVLGTWTANI